MSRVPAARASSPVVAKSTAEASRARVAGERLQQTHASPVHLEDREPGVRRELLREQVEGALPGERGGGDGQDVEDEDHEVGPGRGRGLRGRGGRLRRGRDGCSGGDLGSPRGLHEPKRRDLAARPVLEDLDLVGSQVGDGLAFPVARHQVEQDDLRVRGEGGRGFLRGEEAASGQEDAQDGLHGGSHEILLVAGPRADATETSRSGAIARSVMPLADSTAERDRSVGSVSPEGRSPSTVCDEA